MRWHKSAIAFTALALAVPGNSCGPFFTEAVFVNHAAPVDQEAFLNGHLGVVQGGLSPRYLALAYRMLSGPPLTAGERASLLPPPVPVQEQTDDAVQNRAQDGTEPWWKERAQVAPATGDGTLLRSRTVPGQQWVNYDNCLNDAFANAARTLDARARDHAAEKAELAEWVHGQDAVFSNCSGNGNMPAPVSKPLWLVQDRAYQTAAAHFYRSEFASAQEQFQQIALDRDSPLRSLAAYMAGRCMLRQATLSLPDKNDDALLRQAAGQFRKVIQAGGPYAGAAEELLNFAELRLDPGVATARLGDLISRPDSRLKQHLVDFAYASRNGQWLSFQQDARKSDLVNWALTMEGFAINPHKPPLQKQVFDHAKDRWRQTGNVAWLLAALTHAQAPDDELDRAAANVPPTSPAWVSIAYGRLQMLPAGASARTQAEKLLWDLAARHESPDTVNRFTILARQKAESLHEYVRLAPLEPVGEDDGEDGFEPLPSGNVTPRGGTRATMTSLPVNVQGAKRLDAEAAHVLNRQLPLKELVPLVVESTWPKQLRFELAMAVWTRAVLLDRPELARSLTPTLMAGELGWKPWLAAYDAAGTEDERRVSGLLALMRFPSVRPYVNAGAGREEGFAGYSVYRDNWWCADMGGPDYSNGHNFNGASPNPNQPQPESSPAFLTPAMEADAKQEWAELARIPDAPEYFGSQALAWVKAHPNDHRNPEVLGFAFRTMRNGCNLEKSATLKREVFATLHSKYAQSEWARKYRELGLESQ
jgi:hypothetical protein